MDPPQYMLWYFWEIIFSTKKATSTRTKRLILGVPQCFVLGPFYVLLIVIVYFSVIIFNMNIST